MAEEMNPLDELLQDEVRADPPIPKEGIAADLDAIVRALCEDGVDAGAFRTGYGEEN